MDEYLLFFLRGKHTEIMDKLDKSILKLITINVTKIIDAPKCSWYLVEKHQCSKGEDIMKSKIVKKGENDNNSEVNIDKFEIGLCVDGIDVFGRCLKGDSISFQIKEYNKILSNNVIGTVTITKDEIIKSDNKTIQKTCELTSKYQKKFKAPVICINVLVEIKGN